MKENKDRKFFSPLRFAIGIFVALFIQTECYFFLRGKAFSSYQSSTVFDSESALYVQQVIAQAPRPVGSEHYNQSITFLFQRLTQLTSSKGNINNITVSYSFESGNITAPADRNINHFQSSIRSIVLRFNQSGFTINDKPLIFSAHIDSHAITTGSYDDAINIALMTGVAKAIVNTENIVLKQPIIFVFLGSEEMGLHGSEHFMYKNMGLEGSHVMNLESLGVRRPFGLIWKAKKSSSVTRAFSKTVGGIVATFFTDISRTNLLKSRTDLDVYQRYGLHGGQTVFFGNPAVYHTLMDSERSIDDITYAGKLLTDFAMNFKVEEEETDVVAFGIAPFVLIIEKSVYKTVAYSVAIASLATVFFLKFDLSTYLRCFGELFGLIIGFLFYASFVNMVNTVSYASSVNYWFIIIIIFGISIFLMIELYHFEPSFDSWIALHIVLDAGLLALTADFDISVVILLSLVPQVILAVLRNVSYVVQCFLVFVELIPTSLAISMIYPVIVGYMGSVPGKRADLVPIAIVLFYCIHLIFAVMPISRSSSRNEGLQYQMGIQVLMVFVFTGIFLFSCIKPKPYSLDYPILVSLAEYIFENSSAVISMMPIAGERTISGIVSGYYHKPDIKYLEKFRRFDISGPAFVQEIPEVSLPRWMNEGWPKFYLKELGFVRNKRIIGFGVLGNISAFEFDAVALVVHCTDGKCIDKINENSNLLYNVNEEGEDVAIVRFAPCFSGITLNISMNTPKKMYFDVLFISSQMTKERSKFKNSFKNFVQNYAKSYLLADTVLVSSRLV